MPVVTLTDRFVATIKPTEDRIDYTDTKNRLVLRVAPTGVKSFSLLYYAPGGRRARLSLGKYPHVTLASARARALEALSRVQDGQDPRYSAAATVAEIAEQWLALHVRPTLRSAKAVERRFVKNVLPVIGSIPLAELHKRDVNRVLSVILARGSRVEAARVFEDVRSFLRWAVARGDLDADPLAGMRRPTIPPPRERALSEKEMATLWKSLPKALPRSPTVQKIIKLCLLTAQRVGEVAGIEPTELDAKKRTWTIPAQRSKNGYAHAVALTDLSLALAQEIAGGDKLPGHAVAKIVRRAQEHFGIPQWTTHDLRRSAVTQMAELGVSPIVSGHVVNHRSVTRAGTTLSVYSQYDYQRETRAALELWADRLDALVGRGGAKVLPIRGRNV
jgi:integrase